LRKAFDANAGDGGDHAAHLARLQSRTIDARSDISEADLRRQFDMMMSESAAIQRTGNAPPSDATLVAHACFLSGRSGIAWCAFDSLLVATYLRLYPRWC
jgi:hypothetical protein